jgi:hypothetical protein
MATDPTATGRLYEVFCALVAGLLVIAAVWALHRRLMRHRPDLAIGWALLVATGVRFVAALALDASPGLAELRGPDEGGFLGQAETAANDGSGAILSQLWGDLHIALMTLQLKLLGPVGVPALRITTLLFAVVGIALLATAAHDLGGPRAGALVAWFLALEPANVFFSGLLHKEALMLAAEGLVVFGAVSFWQQRTPRSLLLMAGGCALAVS